MKTKYRINKIQVIEAIGFTVEQYNDVLFESGIAWIKEQVWNDDVLTLKVSSNTFFWQWYTNQWNIIEDAFLMDHYLYVLQGEHEEFLKYAWGLAHDIKRINTFPSGAEWDKLMQGIIKKEAANA